MSHQPGHIVSVRLWGLAHRGWGVLGRLRASAEASRSTDWSRHCPSAAIASRQHSTASSPVQAEQTKRRRQQLQHFQNRELEESGRETGAGGKDLCANLCDPCMCCKIG